MALVYGPVDFSNPEMSAGYIDTLIRDLPLGTQDRASDPRYQSMIFTPGVVQTPGGLQFQGVGSGLLDMLKQNWVVVLGGAVVGMMLFRR